jgi:hypothetical protein
LEEVESRAADERRAVERYKEYNLAPYHLFKPASQKTSHQHIKDSQIAMLYTTTILASLAAFSTAQTLNIPTRSGSIISLAQPSTISGSVDYGNKEFDRGRDCDTDADTGSDSAVFILSEGATISNVIIGTRQLEGIHCKGACTLKNVWFRDVCEGE